MDKSKLASVPDYGTSPITFKGDEATYEKAVGTYLSDVLTRAMETGLTFTEIISADLLQLRGEKHT